MNDDRAYTKVLVDAGNGDDLYVSEPITKYSYKNKRQHSTNNYDKKHELIFVEIELKNKDKL